VGGASWLFVRCFIGRVRRGQTFRQGSLRIMRAFFRRLLQPAFGLGAVFVPEVVHQGFFGGQVGTVGHINIGANSVYAARSGIIADMPEGVFCAGFPVQPHTEWLRVQAAIRRLPDLAKKVKSLERELEQLRGKD